MFLKSLEIFGFKSFADRMKIEFPSGISALIGPNGCGKSNVVDSIKWVLGEQSNKTLRASRMEAVIFNGTETRKALNVAEVTLVLSNDNGILPLDIPEVSVKRRLYRSGESEYFINGKSVKLKELRELFFDTGIGKSAYSIMEQGKIDQILSTKPEERRYIFEEAAGITKYKARGAEAEQKLKRTEENIHQAENILVEVKRSHDTLQRQAQKTEKYRKVKDQIFDIEVKIRLLRLKNLLETKHEIDTSLKDLTDQRQNNQKEIDGINESMEQNIDQVNTMESRLIESQKTLYGIDIEKSNKESQKNIFQERIRENQRKTELDLSRMKNFKEKIQTLTLEKERKENDFKQLEAKIQDVNKNITSFKKDIDHFNLRIKNNDSEISINEERIQGLEKEMEKLNLDLREITEDIVTQLDSKLKETGYSINDRQTLENTITDIIQTLKIQISGKAKLLGDIKSIQSITEKDAQKVLSSIHDMVEASHQKIIQLSELFNNFKSSIPNFLDEFLSPEGIITKKRKIDQLLNQISKEIDTLKTRNINLKTENKEISLKIEEYRKTLEELNVNQVRMQTQKTAMGGEITRLQKDLEEQEKALAQNLKEIEESKAKLKELQEMITKIEGEIKLILNKEKELQKNLSELEKNISSKNKTLSSNEKKLKDKMSKLLNLQSKIEKAQMKLTEITVEIKNIYQNFIDLYSRDLKDFEDDMYEIRIPEEKLKNQLLQLKEELKQCGQVNLMAPEEFLEVKERYEFLTNQIDDLKKAREDLRKVTSEIQTESAELFVETYNQIKKNFHMMFRRLFGGGRGELKLTDPDNVLESGIDILAQPPGKKLESIALLSGGERSMTGVALLFATYMVKPSPFCILDEIDAALDEENVTRFTNVLQEFHGQSQFIIITHNKRTISGTEAMFGITMEESGVSKIITVRLKSDKRGEETKSEETKSEETKSEETEPEETEPEETEPEETEPEDDRPDKTASEESEKATSEKAKTDG